ncbi:MAG: peptidase U32 family protein [Bacillota bacterium]
MKILAPVCSAEEATSLISCGAGELYCGLHPEAWKKNDRKEAWVNRRGPGPANIGTLEELKEITGLAHSKGVPVFLTINLPFYPPGQYPDIISLAKNAVLNCGIDALIIGDPGMITAIRDAVPKAVIHISSLAAVLNSSSVSFFRALGASRIIFPRYLSTNNLKAIISETGPGIEYEVFILNDGCVYEEGYCHASHAFGGAFCHHPWQYRPVRTCADKQSHPAEPFRKHIEDYNHWLWCIRNCNGAVGPGGFYLGMCGLCAIPDLKTMGIASLKIVGREASLHKKTTSVRLVRKALDLLNSRSYDNSTIRKMIMSIKNTPALCTSGHMCYFR